jgi:hypothetical protein
MREVLVELDAGAMPGKPAKALVVRVAQLLAQDRRERAPRDAALPDAGSRRRGVADEALQRRPVGAPPVTVVRLAEPLRVGRAPAASRGAGCHGPRAAQVAGALAHPLLLGRLAVTAPHHRVRLAEVAADALRALQAARVAAGNRAGRPEQRRIAGLGQVDLDLELRTHAGAQQLLPAGRPVGQAAR